VKTNKSVDCCNENGMKQSPRYTHPSCAPIIIPKNDGFFSPLRRTCMNYVRSIPAMRTDCTFGPREQVSGRSITTVSYARTSSGSSSTRGGDGNDNGFYPLGARRLFDGARFRNDTMTRRPGSVILEFNFCNCIRRPARVQKYTAIPRSNAGPILDSKSIV